MLSVPVSPEMYARLATARKFWVATRPEASKNEASMAAMVREALEAWIDGDDALSEQVVTFGSWFRGLPLEVQQVLYRVGESMRIADPGMANPFEFDKAPNMRPEIRNEGNVQE